MKLGFITLCLLGSIPINIFSKNIERPNVLLILADDIGYGDLSCHGHPILKTPAIDRLASESVCFSDFHVTSMSTPTRSSLMTGIDCLRNGAMATSMGRSEVKSYYPMAPSFFMNAGYETGIFGKWHLGYNYPNRPCDRGFKESLYFNGYGLTGVGSSWGNDYFDPVCLHNGNIVNKEGYCNDIWFDEAMKWMKNCVKNKKNFFCYLPTNIAHFPEWVDSIYSEPYKEYPEAANFFGMVTCLDRAIDRLDAFLKENNLYENTIVVFLSDNGTLGSYADIYNAGMRGGKCARTEGGHRVPCFIRWPKGNFVLGNVKTPTQVQDILPTLLNLCSITLTKQVKFDGYSIVPLLYGDDIEDRMFVMQYFQNDLVKYDGCVIWKNWRLLYGDELYDIQNDPAQNINVISSNREVAIKMKDHYDKWWYSIKDSITTLVPIIIGSPYQEEVELNSSQWIDVRADGFPDVRNPKQTYNNGGTWLIEIEKSGKYVFDIYRWPREAGLNIQQGTALFKPRFGNSLKEGKSLPITSAKVYIKDKVYRLPVGKEDKKVSLSVYLQEGVHNISVKLGDDWGNIFSGAFFVYVKSLN